MWCGPMSNHSTSCIYVHTYIHTCLIAMPRICMCMHIHTHTYIRPLTHAPVPLFQLTASQPHTCTHRHTYIQKPGLLPVHESVSVSSGHKCRSSAQHLRNRRDDTFIPATLCPNPASEHNPKYNHSDSDSNTDTYSNTDSESSHRRNYIVTVATNSHSAAVTTELCVKQLTTWCLRWTSDLTIRQLFYMPYISAHTHVQRRVCLRSSIF
jgi:hypothetical protein